MRFIIGPELFWLILYIIATIIAKGNAPPTKAMDDFIESCWYWIPLISTLIFALWYIPTVEKNWLLLRVWIVGLVGGHFVLEKAVSAYGKQGPGIGMAYLAGLLFIFIILIVGSIFIKIKF